ncbi:uncharacterized protein FA14DRAFT_2289 [Meira miltonrushii]|uniref:Uncharacterized protein n=1 Tax=Meira miltonrushii TaxID=1280837 RepID=A0A316VHG9_9BASI|nr:uncharacterized protein FA14DRAFT_2289 [Meira miltonrushii]PWN36478.1 hypothetical protein FA14DRAFT_2289 [Meira miltonrushii]
MQPCQVCNPQSSLSVKKHRILVIHITFPFVRPKIQLPILFLFSQRTSAIAIGKMSTKN